MIVYRELSSVESDLGFTAKTLYGLSNNIEKHYRNAYIPKKDGSQRRLSVPDAILKSVQRAIAERLLYHLPVSASARAYKPGSSVHKNALPHVGRAKILKLDIEAFFDSISYVTVKERVFPSERFSEPIRILLTMLCYFRDTLPQGAPTSPAITNIIMYEFDEKIRKFCAKRGIAYTRYCDDMTFSGDFDEREVIETVRSELRGLGLFLKDRKTAVIRKGARQTVTGIVVNERLNIRRDYKRKIRQEMYYIGKHGLEGHLARLGVTDSSGYLASLLGRISHVLATTQSDPEFSEYKARVKAML